MRIATAATVSVFSIAVIAAGANIAHFGFKFFTFREAGAGETGGAAIRPEFPGPAGRGGKGRDAGAHAWKTLRKEHIGIVNRR